MADKWFGKFVEALKKNNLYEDTLILFTTDHGHMLGEHGYIAKNFMHAYNELSHLPLLVKMPRKEHAGEKRKQLTQNIDLMPTILEYHGISLNELIGNDKMKPVRAILMLDWIRREPAVAMRYMEKERYRAPQAVTESDKEMLKKVLEKLNAKDQDTDKEDNKEDIEIAEK